MTTDQKETIHQLRCEGKGYTQIASFLGISENTIKSFCRRNRLQQHDITPISKTENQNGDTCKQCGKRLFRQPKQKPRKFCSDACRLGFWKAHKDELNKKAVYLLTCACCGRKFGSYGNQSRKYCGHPCYINKRFSKGA